MGICHRGQAGGTDWFRKPGAPSPVGNRKGLGKCPFSALIFLVQAPVASHSSWGQWAAWAERKKGCKPSELPINPWGNWQHCACDEIQEGAEPSNRGELWEEGAREPDETLVVFQAGILLCFPLGSSCLCGSSPGGACSPSQGMQQVWGSLMWVLWPENCQKVPV